ncbi:acetyltransferase [Pelagerythrobacter sp.]|uniref:acetyltransferase n=1 Tax=Pelagerythrobacter sp. TaxID=2800702 RepID=UPI0035ADDFBF
MRHLAIYGAGGAGRGVMPLLRAAARPGDTLYFIDDGEAGREINGHRALAFAEFAALAGEKRAALAVADADTRRALADRCADAGVSFLEVRAESVVEMDDVRLGEGAILSPFVVLTSNIRIGRHFHANLYSCVEHDCVIGDFVTFAPSVRCNGAVTIGDGAYVGANAVIRQGLSIGAGATVGMGAVVTRDVPAGETWVGNPARRLDRSGGG